MLNLGSVIVIGIILRYFRNSECNVFYKNSIYYENMYLEKCWLYL